MALLRLASLPSTSPCPNQHHSQHFFPPNSPSLSASFPNRLIKTLNPNLLRFRTLSAIETPQLQHTSDAADQSEEEEDDEDEGSRTRLLAQNVPWSCTADDVRPLFEKYGTVVEIEVSMYNKTRNRGLVFVEMSSHEEAVAALTDLQSYEFMGRALNLAWAKPRKTKKPSAPMPSKPAPVHNLFVANLPFQARSKDLLKFFNAENANVVSAEIIFHENPRGSAGYGFVSFNTKEEAEAALSAFQGKVFMGRSIRVAPSKRFLRQSTKKTLESKHELNEAEPEQAQG